MGYRDEQPSRMLGLGRARVGVSQGRDRLGSGDRGSGFFGATPTCYFDTCNARHGVFREPPNEVAQLLTAELHLIIRFN